MVVFKSCDSYIQTKGQIVKDDIGFLFILENIYPSWMKMTNTAAIDNSYLNFSASTPMMQQYLNTKAEYKDCLLFYRMGDFYELFFNDALIAAKVLDIALTKRGKHQDEDIPMCGVPHHAYEPYLHKLIKAGYKVAICEQMETPQQAKKRGYKAVVKREVVRIATPGTLMEESLLEARESNYLCTIASVNGQFALAWLDISTGQFLSSMTNETGLFSDLARINAKEILISDQLFASPVLNQTLKNYKRLITTQVNSFFDYKRALKCIKQFYGITTLSGIGNFTKAEISAIGSLLEYVELTQKGNLPRLLLPVKYSHSDFMVIDATTRRNLELTCSLSGSKKGSLLDIIDKTRTAAGARLLIQYLNSPLLDEASITRRLDMVQFFHDQSQIRNNLHAILERFPDIERALSRISIGKASPRDLTCIRDGLGSIMLIIELFEFCQVNINTSLKHYISELHSHDGLKSKLESALKEEVGVLARDGNFIKSGYNAKLDELRIVRTGSRNSLSSLQEKYRKETNINTLKVSYNNVLGYFVEVTPANSSKVTDSKFIHRQTLASAVRYTTEELRKLESDILGANEQALQLELAIFSELVEDILRCFDSIAIAAHNVSMLDVVSSLAELAIKNNYVRPNIDNSCNFIIKAGRHPVVEKNIANIDTNGNDEFIANNCSLTAKERLWLLTGPNMAGKSTFLRQNALIAIMAQMGSFVPASSANIGIVDRLFSRIGASDDLAQGQSTFMVEMTETATILNQASKRSLVILDEIGRGTATYDGLSIAWAAVEQLHNVNKCRALFATHYHELSSLTASLAHIACHSMKVKEWHNEVVFMHQVVEGSADRSYGIYVARLAGVPQNVIKRATEVLNVLQKQEGKGTRALLTEGLPLFNAANNNNTTAKIQELLQNADIDNMSPKEALDFLYNLKELSSNTN